MLATISHEQMNPLNSIMNFTSYLQDKTEAVFPEDVLIDSDSDSSYLFSSEGSDSFSDKPKETTIAMPKSDIVKQATVLKIIMNSSRLMNLLNQAILNLNLIKQNKFSPNFVTVKDPFEVLNPFAAFFDQTVKQKNLKLKIEQPVGGCAKAAHKLRSIGVQLDVEVYQQVLYNILANSCKFSTDRGQIDIRVEIKPSLAGGLVLETEICDEGEGMDEQKLRSLFKVFENIKT